MFSIPVRFFRPEPDLADSRALKARTIVITWWLTCLVLLPYALDPESESLYIFSRGAMVLTVPPYITKFIKCYYEDNWKFSWKMALVRAPLMLTYVIVCFFTSQSESCLTLALIFGSIEVMYLVRHLTRVVRILKKANSSEFSSEDDFRYKMVIAYLYSVLSVVLVIYVLFFCCSRWAIVIRDLLVVVLNGVFLTLSVFPHGHLLRAFSQTSEAVAQYKEEEGQSCLPELTARMGHIKDQIVDIVETKRGFLDPHLSLDQIVEHLDCGKTIASKVLSQEFGGFYNYVNGLRVQWADDYAKTHPFATKDEIAECSGFSSRQTLASATKKLKQNIQN